MTHFPIHLDVAGRPCLVVGGSDAAVAKIRLLFDSGADITVTTIVPQAQILDWAIGGVLTLARRRFQPDDLKGKALVFIATGEPEREEEVAALARAAGIPVNVVDRPQLSTFLTPAMVRRGPIQISVSSGGAAPVLARRIRGDIEKLLPPTVARLAEWAGRQRPAIRAQISDPSQRRRYWEDLFDGPQALAILAGQEEGEAAALPALANDDAARAGGRLETIAVDPAAPDLLTLRALQQLQRAEVVVHDADVPAAILDYARREAERVAVTSGGDRAAAQLAAQGRRVVRLRSPGGEGLA